MMRAISFTQPGGPEQLRVSEIPVPDPLAGEVRVRHTAIGVNFIDIYHRTGLYPLRTQPAIPGGATLLRTFSAVRRFGTVASIGQAGGAIPPIDVNEIGPIRSLNLARPSVMAYAAEQETYREAASEVIDRLKDGVMPEPGRTYLLDEAASAHADLEAGRTTGSIALLPR